MSQLQQGIHSFYGQPVSIRHSELEQFLLEHNVCNGQVFWETSSSLCVTFETTDRSTPSQSSWIKSDQHSTPGHNSSNEIRSTGTLDNPIPFHISIV